MILFFNYIRNHLKSIFLIILFFIVSVLVTYMLPHEGKFMYEYQKGGFWKHEDLTAPFNFPIYKSKTELDHERDSVLREFKPFFNYENKIIDQRVNELIADFTS